MKALQMSFLSEAKKAVKSPVSNMSKLCGGIGSKPLTQVQIQKLLRAQREEKKRRKEKEDWEKFLFGKPGTKGRRAPKTPRKPNTTN